MGKQVGFTLVELIVVIAIMVVVFAVGIPVYSSYTSERTFTALVEEAQTQARYVYTNSVQGVLGADKDSNNSTGNPPNDADTNTDRVAWFIMIDKGSEKYAIGACLPEVRPNSIARCINDRDYREKDLSASVNINFDVPVTPTYSGNVIYIVFTPITGSTSVWGTTGTTPLISDQNIDVVFTSRADATRSATLKINAQGGIR